MLAKRKADGKVFEVYPVSDNQYLHGVSLYQASDLDFDVEEETEEVTIEGWICRDGGGGLFLCGEKPTREYDEETSDDGFWDDSDNSINLDRNLFPNITWHSEPRFVTITIKAKKK